MSNKRQLTPEERAWLYATSKSEGFILDFLEAEHPAMAALAEEGFADYLSKGLTRERAFTALRAAITGVLERVMLERRQTPPTLN